MNPEFTHGRPLGPEGPGNEAKREDLSEFAAHRDARSGSSMLGGILTLAGAVLVFVATIVDSTQWAVAGVSGMKLVVFLGHYPVISFGERHRSRGRPCRTPDGTRQDLVSPSGAMVRP